MWLSDSSSTLITFQQTLFSKIRTLAPIANVVVRTPSLTFNDANFLSSKLQSANIGYGHASVGFNGEGMAVGRESR